MCMRCLVMYLTYEANTQRDQEPTPNQNRGEFFFKPQGTSLGFVRTARSPETPHRYIILTNRLQTPASTSGGSLGLFRMASSPKTPPRYHNRN